MKYQMKTNSNKIILENFVIQNENQSFKMMLKIFSFLLHSCDRDFVNRVKT